MNKEQLKQKANHLYNYLLTEHSDLVLRQTCLSKLYNEHSKFTKHPKQTPTQIILQDRTTLQNFQEVYEPNTKIGVLNFSDFQKPCGKFLDGEYAQEEYLCHHTTLSPILFKHPHFYTENRLNLNRGLYFNRAIYSDIVSVLNTPYKVSIVTCASPNKRYMLRSGKVTQEENLNTIYSRIEFILDIFTENNCDVLILGAYGCGVFKQEPTEVAQAFKDLLQQYNFKKVYFRIPNEYSTNYLAFKGVFNL